jgi:hypothetical protein
LHKGFLSLEFYGKFQAVTNRQGGDDNGVSGDSQVPRQVAANAWSRA